MGPLPTEPIVGYLARSTSALYALLGALFWAISFDPPRHRPILLTVGTGIVGFGIALFFVDRAEGLPLAWRLWEGPFVAAFGQYDL